jgi:hypothetical protein
LTLRRIALFVPPLLAIAFELGHPVLRPPMYPAVSHHLPWWLYLHLANLAIFPLLGLSAFLLVQGLEGRAASIARAAAVVYVPLYAAFDALAGIGTGVLVQNASAMDEAPRAAAESLIDSYWGSGVIFSIAAAGSIAWIIATFAAAVAVTPSERRRAAAIVAVLLFAVDGRAMKLILPPADSIPTVWWFLVAGMGLAMFAASRRPAAALLVLAGALFGAGHVPPTGPLGAAGFLAAAALLELSGRSAADEQRPKRDRRRR